MACWAPRLLTLKAAAAGASRLASDKEGAIGEANQGVIARREHLPPILRGRVPGLKS